MEYLIDRAIKSKSGSFSILFVLLIFIMVIMIDFLVSVLIYRTTISEIESLVSNSADSAIQYALDSSSHRTNNYYVDEYKLRIKFEDLINYSLREISYINKKDIQRIYVENFETSRIRIGDGNRLRFQTTADFAVELNTSERLFSRKGSSVVSVKKRMVYSSAL